jgi:hypothetical protein
MPERNTELILCMGIVPPVSPVPPVPPVPPLPPIPPIPPIPMPPIPPIPPLLPVPPIPPIPPIPPLGSGLGPGPGVGPGVTPVAYVAYVARIVCVRGRDSRGSGGRGRGKDSWCWCMDCGGRDGCRGCRGCRGWWEGCVGEEAESHTAARREAGLFGSIALRFCAPPEVCIEAEP